MRVNVKLPCSAKDLKKLASLLDGRESDWNNRVYGMQAGDTYWLSIEVDREVLHRKTAVD